MHGSQSTSNTRDFFHVKYIANERLRGVKLYDKCCNCNKGFFSTKEIHQGNSMANWIGVWKQRSSFAELITGQDNTHDDW